MKKLLRSTADQEALGILHFLIAHETVNPEYIEFASNHLSINWFFKSTSHKELKTYLQNLIQRVHQQLSQADKTDLSPILVLALQKFLHLNPQQWELNIPASLERKELGMELRSKAHMGNTLRNNPDLVDIHYDQQTGLYTSPDDHLAHQHGKEALRIFIATQFERIKSWLNWIFSKMGLYIFENAPYAEHNYLHSDIYTDDLAIDPLTPEQASHFFVGHATNLLSIPTTTGPLHVLTDPVEGDLNPWFYPRMTEAANTIDSQDETMLPKVDVVLISHNHRDHVDIATLQKLVNQQPKMIIPAGDMELFKGLGFKHIVEMQWWEQTVVYEQNQEILRITATPARHWSGRGLFDAHHSAFNGYVLQAPAMQGDIYFAGDTALMEDRLTQPLFAEFNIQTSIQPGGPDETRADMQSTHQSSADAVLMHCKNLLANYQKMQALHNKPDLAEFLRKVKDIKTIYNHTATYKLGNLRLRDTFYSLNRLLRAFSEDELWQKNNLTANELHVLQQIKLLIQSMTFKAGELLTPMQLKAILTQGIIMPKIGQRTGLNTEVHQEIHYRDLILNKRALQDFDQIMQALIKEPQFTVQKFLLAALKHYQNPWHAFFTRSSAAIAPFYSDLQKGKVDVLTWIKQVEQGIQVINPQGHLSSLIHYTKWLLQTQEGTNPKQVLQDFFACQKIRQQVDTEIHSIGSFTCFSHSRADKQIAFKILGNQLAKTPTTPAAYQKTITTWRRQLIDENGVNLLSQPRLFNQAPTHSDRLIESLLLNPDC